MNTKKDNIIVGVIFLVIFSIALSLTLSIKDNRTLNYEIQELTIQIELKLEALENLDIEQKKIIRELKLNLNDHDKSIDINFDKINNLYNQLIELRISDDEISEQSFYFIVDEIWETIDLLEKRIK